MQVQNSKLAFAQCGDPSRLEVGERSICDQKARSMILGPENGVEDAS